MNETTMERELGWEDEIENEGSPRRVLEVGEYPFTVESFERARFGGSEKVPPCPQAIVHLRIDTPKPLQPLSAATITCCAIQCC